MNTALFFGSFNPIHTAHISIALHALAQKEIDQVWLIISPQSPYKIDKEMASSQDRLTMAKIACAEESAIEAFDIELQLPTPSYTIDTLEALEQGYPTHQFSLLLGEDNVANLHKWKAGNEILAHYPIYYFPRENSPKIPHHQNIHQLNQPTMEVCSTAIREAIAANQTPPNLHPKVLAYILKHKLYS